MAGRERSIAEQTGAGGREAVGGRGARELALGGVAFLVVVGLSFGMLAFINRTQSRRPAADGIVSPVGEKPIEITLVHSNDTWGYLDPCG